tara:strand:- start:126 stop:1061 length:936 start_codon:yes stop_codon:yes gene_type:complete
MSILLNGDCLEELKGVDDDSVDLVFCDLPYGQTSCKWDCPIDLDKFWVEIMRVKKLHTPIFMTTTTKFGVSLINSAPKKCHFRYDIVWVKSAPAGFLSAKKMPMRKHEMIYVFYEKLPFYDLSSHQQKFIKETVNNRNGKDGVDNKGMIKNRSKTEIQNKYDPPLPNSVIKGVNNTYNTEGRKKPIVREEAGKYDPPLPNSVIKDKQDCYDKNKTDDSLRAGHRNKVYDPPLPNTMLEIKSTRGKHSTEKPVALMEWLFKYYSKEGDVILDPTMGSGSTGVACKNMNRNFIGIEKDPEIYEVAVNRLEALD